jgi:hypothetical protein
MCQLAVLDECSVQASGASAGSEAVEIAATNGAPAIGVAGRDMAAAVAGLLDHDVVGCAVCRIR